jgi:hypothetical protein
MFQMEVTACKVVFHTLCCFHNNGYQTVMRNYPESGDSTN